MRTQMIRSGWKYWVLVSLMTGLLSAGYPLQKAAADEDIQAEISNRATHYIVFEKYADGTASPVYYRLVELDAPLVSLTEVGMTETLANPSRNAEQIVVSLQGRDGKILYQNVIQVSPWLRGEFAGKTPDDTIDGHLVSLDTTSFVVRVPQVEGTTLFLINDKLQTMAQFDMQQLALSTPQIELDPSMSANALGLNIGPASNRVDFLVMGDGYLSAQQTKFNTDAASTTTTFFSISPYFEYSNYVNIHSLFTVSSQSGADHPPYNASCGSNDPTCCADSAMLSDPLQGTMVNTAFDSRFCTNAIHRLLVPNFNKILAAAAAVPDWDTILLLVNDSTYGGSGGYISTVSMHSAAAQIAEHEYGHSFVGLADEYESAYPGYPNCSDISGSACESNVTDVTNPALIKWKAWINAGTPIPTPNDPFYDGIVGLFQGARYKSTGMYRSGYSCIMRYLGAPYCQVPSQSYVLKLYQGGWGVPANGVSLIEPGSNTPANPNVNLTHPNTQAFHADSLSPAGVPPVQITWLKNGVPIPGASGNNYIYAISVGDPTLVHITMRVKDTTSLVIPAMSGGALQNEFTWNVTVSYNAYTISGNTGIGGVTLSYTDGTPKTVTSLANGNYSFQVLSGWSGTVTPSKVGYNFSPAGRIYTNVTTNLADQNYEAMVNISGDVGVAGATLSYNDGTARTSTSLQDGGYILSVSYNWSGTVTPSHACYTFNPANRSYSNVITNQSAQNYTPTIKPGCANVVVGIAGIDQGTYGLAAQTSTRDSYTGENAGPVKVTSTNTVPFLVAERDAWLLNGVVQSFSEMTGLPGNQVTDTYYFPWYNNVTMDTQLRFANLGNTSTNITVTIAGVAKLPIALAAGESTRVSYPVNNGPVKVQSSGGVPIIVAERDAWLVNGVVQSFSEMMGLPGNQLTDTYYFPWYNNVTMDTQLRFANLGNTGTNITVTIAGVAQPVIPLAAGVSTRVSYSINNGPVKVQSSGGVPIIVAERDAWLINGVVKSFSEMMGLPGNQLTTTYHFPWYNNVTMDTQLRFANLGNTATNITVTIAGIAQPVIPLAAGVSTRISYSVNNGPVQVTSSGGVPIIVAERDAWLLNGAVRSFSEMMGLPGNQLTTTYYFPWYNNLTMDTQLRFAVP